MDYYLNWYQTKKDPAVINKFSLFDACEAWDRCRIETLGENVNDAYFAAVEWWRDRSIDFGYLQHAPQLQIWRVGNQIYLVGTSTEPWTPLDIRLKLTPDELTAAILEFTDDLVLQMAATVKSIVNDGWQGKPCTIDVEHLVLE